MKWGVRAAKWHSCAKGWFRSCETTCEMGAWLRNFRSTLRGCLQTAITSSFQLQFVHRLKRWTPDFPRFKTRYSMNEMDSSKYLKYVQQFPSSWISLDFSLCFSSLHSWCAFGKGLQSLDSSCKWASICFAMDYIKLFLILGLLWWSKYYQKHPSLTQFD